MTNEKASGTSPETTPESGPEFPSATKVIAAFGGIRPMAARLDVPVSTVQGWKQRDVIPENRMEQIRAAARSDGIDLATLPEATEEAGEAGEPAAQVGSGPVGSTAVASESADTGAGTAQSSRSSPLPSPSSSAHTGGAGSALAVLALLVALAAGGAAGWLWWTQQQVPASDIAGRFGALESAVAKLADRSDTVTPDQLKALAGRVDALAGKLDKLSTMVPDTARLDALGRDIASVKAAVTDMRAAVSANSATQSALRTGVDATMSDVSGRLVAVEKRQGDTAAVQARAVGLAISAAEIRRTLRSGAPFAGELATLRALADTDTTLAPAIATLAAAAPKGLPTASGLARRFDGLIGDILTADRVQADAPWYRQALDRVSGLVSVRRIGGDSAGDSVDAIVARTEAKLVDGDLAGAVAEAATLQGGAGEIVAPWIKAARDLLTAEDAVAAINTRALAALASARGN